MATKTTNEFLGTGRRKTAIARVRLATGSGKITVNGRAFENYFPLDTQRATVSSPLAITGTADKVDVFPHARPARTRAQEIRPARRPQTLPVLEALIARKFYKTRWLLPAGFLFGNPDTNCTNLHEFNL